MTDNALTGGDAPDGANAPLPDEVLVQTTGAEVDDPAPVTQENTAEAPKAEPETPAEKISKLDEAHQKAFNKMAFEKREAERRAREFQARLEELEKAQKAPAAAAVPPEGDTVPRSEVERLAREQAQRIAAEQAAEKAAQDRAAEFNRAADDVYQAGVKEFPEFDSAVQNLRNLGFMTYNTVEAALATDNPQRVIYELGKNPAEAERITSLPPLKMAVELAKIASKAPVPAKKDVSAAPPPVKPIEGNVKPGEDPRDEDTDTDWAHKFEKKYYGRAR